MPAARGDGIFVKLYVEWLDSEKLSRAGMACRGVHATAMCHAKRSDRDGWFPRYSLVKEGADDELIDECIAREILEVDGTFVRPWDWLDRNLSQNVISATKARAGSMGNHSRWGHPGEWGDCPICHPVAERAPELPFRRTGVACDRTGRTASPESESESESETDTPSQSSELLQEKILRGVAIDDVYDAIVDLRYRRHVPDRNPDRWRQTTRANLPTEAYTKIAEAIDTYDEPATTIAEIVEGHRTNLLGLRRRPT